MFRPFEHLHGTQVDSLFAAYFKFTHIIFFKVPCFQSPNLVPYSLILFLQILALYPSVLCFLSKFVSADTLCTPGFSK